MIEGYASSIGLNFNTQISVSDDVNKLIDNALAERERLTETRDYLGASSVGEDCLRKLQLIYKQQKPSLTAQNLRIFDIGKMLEAVIIGWMRRAGFELEVMQSNGEQFGFSTANGKIKGHVDGVITKFPLEFEKKYPPREANPCRTHVLWECKTMNSKSWKETIRKGLFVSKPIYYAQLQMYMAYMDMTNLALITCLNKDSAELYHELIVFDQAEAQKYSDRAALVVKATENGEELPCISADRDFFKCKMCGFYEMCLKMRRI